LAKEFADVFIPMDGIFARYAVEGIREADMSADGVHPTPRGHGIIAAEWLKALGII
jgi:lysophospholipase L1-like esterase